MKVILLTTHFRTLFLLLLVLLLLPVEGTARRRQRKGSPRKRLDRCPQNLDSNTGTIQSPDYPESYSPGTKCKIKIKTDVPVKFMCDEFNLRKKTSKKECMDSFSIKSKGKKSEQFCGSEGPEALELPAGRHVIKFRASGKTLRHTERKAFKKENESKGPEALEHPTGKRVIKFNGPKKTRGYARRKASKQENETTSYMYSCSWEPISNGLLERAKTAIEDGVCYGETRLCDCEGITKKDSEYVKEDDIEAGVRLVAVSGIPNHEYEVGQELLVNQACPHEMYALLPLNPVKGNEFMESPLGPVGVALSGGFIFNHRAGPDGSVAVFAENRTFDNCQGHSTPLCQYHYHLLPICIATEKPCAILGYSLDGFPIYGYCPSPVDPSRNLKSCYQLNDGENGSNTSHYTFSSDALEAGECDLDEANGFDFGDDRGYAYFFSSDYPYSPSGYFGTELAQACFMEEGEEFIPGPPPE